MTKAVRLLLVEDSAEDAELIVRELGHAGFEVAHTRVCTLAQVDAALDLGWDVIVCDLTMPGLDWTAAFELCRRRAPLVPFVCVSDAVGEERAVEVMRAGAKDYVLKHKLSRLPAIVSRELEDAAVRRDRAEAERRLKFEERRYHSIFESAAVALMELDLSDALDVLDGPSDDAAGSDGDDVTERAAGAARVVAANAAAMRLMDAARCEDLLGPTTRVFGPESRAGWRAALRAVKSGTGTFQREVTLTSLSGRSIDVLLAFQVPPTREQMNNVVVSMTDVTERNSLEKQMRAAQRLEAIGRLAGGVAHDFNNILTVISSYAVFLLEALSEGDPLRADVEVIQDAASRAEGLTRQLLAFSRKQVAELRVLSLNDMVRDVDRMLRRLIGEDVDLATSLEADLGLVEIDPSHVEQILLNLSVNARDAMPNGGKLTLETRNVTLDDASAGTKLIDVTRGEYVMLALSDTGMGMDDATKLHIFEPFFTTKEAGKGTGLGLATVYGIVKQAAGYIWVYSEPGIGTTFKIYLPRKTHSRESYRPARTSDRPAAQASGTVLVVEDEDHVRRAARRILDRAGYSVLVASSGEEAMELCARHDGPLDAVLTDIVMPGMNGRELSERLLAKRPGVKVLYMSGYTDDAIVHHGVLDQGVAFLQKPFTPENLLAKLRETLDGA